MYPERDDVLIVRRLIENATRDVQETWDVQTVAGETLAVQCPTREHAEREARRTAQHRQVSVFYEHDPSSAESILAFVVSYRADNAAPIA
jgi:hypothetical protein